MDRFPEAFDRFESDIDLSDVKTFPQLTLEFMLWGKERATLSNKQTKALMKESSVRKIGNITQNRIGRYIDIFTKKFLKKKDYEELL